VLQALLLVKVVTAIPVGRVLVIRRHRSDRQSQVIMKGLTEQEEDLAVTTTYASCCLSMLNSEIFTGCSCWHAQHVNALR
jgi:hypothetical protein